MIPTADQALLQIVVAAALDPLRADSERKELKEKSLREDSAIEDAFLSEPARRQMARGVAAYVEQHTPRLVVFVFEQAFKGESWACRMIFDAAGVTEKIKAAFDTTAEETDAFISTGFERRLIEKLRRLTVPEDLPIGREAPPSEVK